MYKIINKFDEPIEHEGFDTGTDSPVDPYVYTPTSVAFDNMLMTGTRAMLNHAIDNGYQFTGSHPVGDVASMLHDGESIPVYGADVVDMQRMKDRFMARMNHSPNADDLTPVAPVVPTEVVDATPTEV